MRITLLSLVFLFLSHLLPAQTDFRFADSTAQWNELSTDIDYENPYFFGTNVYNCCKDTLIEEIGYQRLGGDADAYGVQFIRRDSNGEVFVRSYSFPERKIYDFGKLPGDTILYNGYSFIGTVDSVDSFYIGKWRKRMFIRYVQLQDTFPELIIWVDGIGSVNSNFLNPTDIIECDIGCTSSSLLCYFENNQLLYHDIAYDTCLVFVNYVGIPELSNLYLVQIFPNPATENLINIQFTEPPPDNTTFQLFDITGRMVLQQGLIKNLNQVELPAVAKGVYLYNIISGNEKIHSGKLVLQ